MSNRRRGKGIAKDERLNGITPSEIVLFFGAGVSRPSPTSLPLAGEVIAKIWSDLCARAPGEWTGFTELPKLKQRPQFEVVLDCINTAKPGTVRKLLANL